MFGQEHDRTINFASFWRRDFTL